MHSEVLWGFQERTILQDWGLVHLLWIPYDPAGEVSGNAGFVAPPLEPNLSRRDFRVCAGEPGRWSHSMAVMAEVLHGDRSKFPIIRGPIFGFPL